MANQPRNNSGDFLHADQFELEELRSAVFEGSDRLTRPLALSLLARKDYPGKADDLSRLLMNDDEQPGIRKVAAQELARVDGPEAAEHLRKALPVRDPLVKQEVISALGRIGGDEELKAIRRYRARKSGDVGRAAEMSSRLLAYVTGSRGEGLPAPPRRTWRPASEERAEPVKVTATRGKRLEEALKGARFQLPSSGLTGGGAVGLKCADRDMILLLHSTLEDQGLRSLSGGKALAAVVTERHALEDENWEIRFLVLTEPAEGEDTLRVLVSTVRGEVRFVGTLTLVGENGGTFEVVGVDGPGAIPLTARGTVKDLTIRFELLAAEGRRRPGGRRGVKKR